MGQQVGKRIVMIGSSNAGKSTLAERLATHLSVPFIELDALHWEPNWTPAQPEVFRGRVRDAVETDSWVMAGNYRIQRDVSWPVADTVVWLDLPLRVMLRRCVRRCWQRSRSKELLWGTNKERFWDHLMLWDMDRSLIAYIVRTHRRVRREYAALQSDPQWTHLTFVRLRSVEEIERWFDDIVALQVGEELVSSRS